ncbi:NAD-dependent sorbitol dehydrogenase [Cyanidioschyzon merolae strain 10D]|jgi:L-iditol 2-dehydrogenase|uniref:NAD-dependent sorbitol dehydrogenase n=1 Tax=Cyanidioschyzon merolae (strain NIES-3377 / 10D) TaxID=280699 RepID=M1VE10_CYAM1|nr:NAD-dependent sorbitol dehydrogenase [Cyanidioschyzon merolae strain 10D]BAM78733.1 NAD-dependent sorbitol dehydrogenase [Cyanidioschyzon merolae strain 10D]|eukprot:XP_005535019.1 NAD-dependent sorbitol dehydrogenase [Cyanidioschyzon merolae strain 10D]
MSEMETELEESDAGSVLNEKANPCGVLVRPRELRVMLRSVPAPAPGEVRLQMRCVGICGSDVHYWWHGSCGPFRLHDPMIIGHESAGVVEALGAGVTSLQVGDRVALEPGVPCLQCQRCREGRYNLCPNIKFFATPPVDGSLARYVCHPAAWCYRLPESVSLEEGAMCEPLSVAVHANRRAGTTIGSLVLVLGAGPIGLLNCMVAKAFGASIIVVTDIDDRRLAFAETHAGADAVINTRDLDEHDAALVVQQALDGAQADIALDCAGLESTMRLAMHVVRPGGRICLVGMGSSAMHVPLVDASSREIDIFGVFRYSNTYPTCIALLASGRVNVKPLITHRFMGLEESSLEAAFETARTAANGAVKVMLTIPE